jgi:hypothetical protein
MAKTKQPRIDVSTLAKLDKIGKELEKEHGIVNPSYTQIIEHILNKLEPKK